MTQNEQKNKLLEEEVRKLRKKLQNCEQKRKDLKQEKKKLSRELKGAVDTLDMLRNDKEYFVNTEHQKYHLAECEVYKQSSYHENWATIPVDRADAEMDGNWACRRCCYPDVW